MEIYSIERARASVGELEQLAAIRPSVSCLTNLGSAYSVLGYRSRAVQILEQCAALAQHEPTVLLNLAMAYKDLGKWAESNRAVELAYTQTPDESYIALAYAEMLLRTGHWKQAWPIYESARISKELCAAGAGIPANVPMWRGEEFEGPLLIVSEGGAGDRICYSRWFAELTRRGIDWKYLPYEGMYEIFERLPWAKKHLVRVGEKIDPARWTTQFALPGNFEATPGSVPKFATPFTASNQAIEKFRIARGESTKPLLGICYEANEAFQGGKKIRSLSEGQAMRLVSMTGHAVHWVNLNHKKEMPYPVMNPPGCDSFEDQLGLIANLDGVVTVDTFAMHAAGAMGKPMAVLLSSHSDWKFLEVQREKCVWYESATLYRNGAGGGLELAIETLIDDIRSCTEGVGTGKSFSEFRKLLREGINRPAETRDLVTSARGQG